MKRKFCNISINSNLHEYGQVSDTHIGNKLHYVIINIQLELHARAHAHTHTYQSKKVFQENDQSVSIAGDLQSLLSYPLLVLCTTFLCVSRFIKICKGKDFILNQKANYQRKT